MGAIDKKYAKLLWLSCLGEPKKLSHAYGLWKDDLMRRQSYRIIKGLYKEGYIKAIVQETKLVYYSLIKEDVLKKILTETNLLPPEIDKKIDLLVKFLDSKLIRQNFFSEDIIKIFFINAEEELGKIRPFDLISLCFTIVVINFGDLKTKTAVSFFITTGEQLAAKDREKIERYDKYIKQKIKQNKALQEYLEIEGNKISKIILDSIKERIDKMYYYKQV